MKLLLLLSLTFLAPAAFACQPCQVRAHLVCGPDPKRPNCHNVYTCEGGTCGHHDMAVVDGLVVPPDVLEDPLTTEPDEQ